MDKVTRPERIGWLLGAHRTKYLGEWSAACIMGLMTGLVILIMQRYMSADAVHQLLTFNPADFFTCAAARVSAVTCAAHAIFCLLQQHLSTRMFRSA